MKTYLDLIEKVLSEGEFRQNRTGTPSFSLFGEHFKHDLRSGFPLLTTKHVPFKSIIGELVGFIEGATTAARFRELGCNVWNQNANENQAWLANPYRKGEDDLGPIYGAQWRKWKGSAFISNHGSLVYPCIDQLQNLIDSINTDPFGRRHIVSAWNPAVMDRVALPACHVFFQCYVSRDGHIDMQMYQRSADLFLGVPFNIASYSALLTLIGAMTGLQPRMLHISFGDLHIYENHFDQCMLQVGREPRRLPELTIASKFHFDNLVPDAFQLHGYDPHPAIKAPMAV